MNLAENQTLESKKKKNRFTSSEDENLKSLVVQHGAKNWRKIASFMENRNERQCKERWESYLSPKVNQSAWSSDEDQWLLKLVQEHGRKWVKVSYFFANRSDAACKNRWNFLKSREKQKYTRKSIEFASFYSKDFSFLEDPDPNESLFILDLDSFSFWLD
jgi:hypothetical protein